MPLCDDIVQFYNCRLLLDHQLVRRDLWVRNGRVLDSLVTFYDRLEAPGRRVDCKGLILAPGFIDVQINGGWGQDFSDPSADVNSSLDLVSRELLKHGVVAFCPTLITCLPEHYKKILPKFSRDRRDSEKRAGNLGLHLEGPFINLNKCGMHPKHAVSTKQQVSMQDILEVYGQSLDNVAMVTVAPEIPGMMEVIRELTQRGIKVCIGHTSADLPTGELASQAGACMLTHLFSAMQPFHHRNPHLMGLLASPHVPGPFYFGLITDLLHSHPSALTLAYRSHFKGLVLVSDACPATGLPDGPSCFGGVEVEVSQGLCKLRGSDTLAGSTSLLDSAVRNFFNHCAASKVESLEAASLHPAQMLGLADRGHLGPGARADLVLLNDSLEVLETYLAGERVYSSSESS